MGLGSQGAHLVPYAMESDIFWRIGLKYLCLI